MDHHVPLSAPSPPAGFFGRADLRAQLGMWLESAPCAQHFVISGAPGTGKTALMAQLVDGWIEGLAPQAAIVAHFCVPGDLETRNPIAVAESLATQLVSAVEGYGAHLAATSSGRSVSLHGVANAESVTGTLAGVYIRKLVINSSAEEAWRRLISKPLLSLYGAGFQGKLVILIDGLDEAERFDGPVRLGDLIAGLPVESPLIRLILSTRAPARLLDRLGANNALGWDLSAGAGLDETRADVFAFIAASVDRLSRQGRISPEADLDEFTREATARSDGNFLYAQLLVEMIDRNQTPIGTTDLARLPSGLDKVYGAIVRQVIGHREEQWLGAFEPLLSVLCAAREPLGESQLASFTGLRLPQLRSALRTIGPFLTPPSTAPPYSIYHRTFRDYLTSEDTAEDWYCDEEEAHQMILRSYGEQTQGWRQDAWERVDGYGLRHVVAHALTVAESPEAIEPIATPGFFRAVGRQADGMAAVDAQFQALLQDGVGRNDPTRALRCAWVRHRLQDHQAEQLAYGAADILVRTGRASAAWASLGALDPTRPESELARRNLVTALGRAGQIDLAVAVIDEAQPETRRAGLRLDLAAQVARREPALALRLASEGRAPGGGEVARLCGELATHPMHVDDAWRLAQHDPAAQHAVVRSAAGHAPERAAALAEQVTGFEDRSNGEWCLRDASSALADVCVAAAGHLPAVCQGVIADGRLHGGDVARVLFALALEGDQSLDSDRTLKRLEVWSDAVGFLIGAARLVGAADEPPRSALAEAFLDDCMGRHKGDVDAIARMDLERLRESPEASRLAGEALRHVARDVLRRPFEFPAGGFRALGGALALFDLDAALTLARDASRLRHNGSLVFLSDTLEGIVSRLTPLEPDVGWRIAVEADLHGVLMAWCRAVPTSACDWAAKRIEAIDRQHSTTRVALIGALATKVDPGDPARNAHLASMLPKPAESAKFAYERDRCSGALRRALALLGQETDLPEVSSDERDPSVRDENLEADALHALRHGGRFEDHIDAIRDPVTRVGALARMARATGADVTAPLRAASEVLARNGALPISLLADAISGLVGRSPDSALVLAEQVGHPVFRPLSAHQPMSLALQAAVGRVGDVWCQAGEPSEALAERIASLGKARGDGVHLPVLIDYLIAPLSESVVAPVRRWAQRHDPVLWPQLQAFAAAATRLLDESALDESLALLEPPLQEHLLCRFAAAEPVAAVRLCQQHFDITSNPQAFHSVLAAIAASDLECALALHAEIRWSGPEADAEDALHAIARVAAATNWEAALAILRSLKYENVVGLALHDLAALAATHQSPEPWGQEMSSVLALAAERRCDGYRRYAVEGLIGALKHSAPDPALASQAILLASSTPEFTFLLSDLATVVTTTSDPARLKTTIDWVEQLLQVLD